MVGGWLAGAQGKAVGPGLRGGVGCGSRLTGWWELAVEGNWTWKDWGPEGRRAAGGSNLRPVPNLVGQDMVSARDAKEPPELMAAMLHDHQQDRCRLFKKSRKMCDYPSAQCVECVGKGTSLPFCLCPTGFPSVPYFAICVSLFPVQSAFGSSRRLQDNARRQWDKGHCSRHPVGILMCLESGCRKCHISSWRDTREWCSGQGDIVCLTWPLTTTAMECWVDGKMQTRVRGRCSSNSKTRGISTTTGYLKM